MLEQCYWLNSFEKWESSGNMFKYATLSVQVKHHLQVACKAIICNPYTRVKLICSFKN